VSDHPSLPKLRLSQRDVCQLIDVSSNTLAALEARGDFPPRIALPSVNGAGSGRKRQFITREVELWANGGNWRKLVATRLRRERAS